MDKKIIAINELIEVARRRYHKKKETFYLQIKKMLEAGKEADAIFYLKDMQKRYATRADVESYEMNEAFSAVRKILL